MQTITAPELRNRLKGRDEIALIDVREEGVFSKAHIFLGNCIPLSHLEFRAGRLVPRHATPIVVSDGGPNDSTSDDDGLAMRAARRLGQMGYLDVSVLEGGIEGWEAAGFEIFSGVNVPSKAFGEFVEHYYETPRISAADLAALQEAGDDIVILDSRPMDEFNRMSIPGGVDCPGAELVYRVGTMAPGPSTTVVVNCAGRTRSIIGAQSLINAGIPNKVMALKDGTMGWELAGLECARGKDVHAPAPSGETLDRAMTRAQAVAKRFGLQNTNAGKLASWKAEPDRTTFLLDVRTIEEYTAGHWPGARHAPGGQLVQATDEYVGVRNARIVLADSADSVRATMTASWLTQLGHSQVYVLTEQSTEPEVGATQELPALFQPFAKTMAASELRNRLEDPTSITVIDLADSLTFKKGHIPGASWAVRARLGSWAGKLPTGQPVILTSPDGALAHFTAAELQAAMPELDVSVLNGGTAAWINAGAALETGINGNALTARDDVWWKPYESEGRVREAMEAYLTWEVGLVEQVERDGLVEFRKYE